MHLRVKPKEPNNLAETWEDQAIRQAFRLWKRGVKPPSGVWQRISQQVRWMEAERESQSATSKQS